MHKKIATMAVAAVALALCFTLGGCSCSATEAGKATSSQDAAQADQASFKEERGNLAMDFIRAWREGWTFENGQFAMTGRSSGSTAYLDYVDPASELYAAFAAMAGKTTSELQAMGLPDGYWWSFSQNFADESVEAVDLQTYLVTVSYYGVQNYVTQEMYDRLVEQGAIREVWRVTFNEDNNLINGAELVYGMSYTTGETIDRL